VDTYVMQHDLMTGVVPASSSRSAPAPAPVPEPPGQRFSP
jgi:hypothetical protein